MPIHTLTHIQGADLRAAEAVVDKLALLGWRGASTKDALAFLVPCCVPTNPADEEDLTALLAWLLQRITDGGGSNRAQQQQQQQREAKGGTASGSIQPILACLMELGITELDAERLRRGHGPVRVLCVSMDAHAFSDQPPISHPKPTLLR